MQAVGEQLPLRLGRVHVQQLARACLIVVVVRTEKTTMTKMMMMQVPFYYCFLLEWLRNTQDVFLLVVCFRGILVDVLRRR